MKRVQAGRLVQQAHYKSFQPNPINRAWQLDNMELIRLLGGKRGRTWTFEPYVKLFR